MLTDREQWERMDALPAVRLRVGKEETLIVVTGQGKERFGWECPECGEGVTEVRRWRMADGPWEYWTWHGRLHRLGERGRVRRKKK